MPATTVLREALLVGFLELRNGGHAAPQLLQCRVDARRSFLCLLYCQTVADQAGKVEVVVDFAVFMIVVVRPAG